MYKAVLGLLLLISAALVLYPPIHALSKIPNIWGLSGALADARNEAIMQVSGLTLLFVLLGGVLIFLPEGSITGNLQDCPDCGKNSLSKVHVRVDELNEAGDSAVSDGRNLQFDLEYCTKCSHRRLDGQKIPHGSFYDYIEETIVSQYGKDAPYQITKDFQHSDFEELLQDIEKAKKTKK